MGVSFQSRSSGWIMWLVMPVIMLTVCGWLAFRNEILGLIGIGTRTDLTIAGKLVNSKTGEWPNDHLVLFFLKGKEIGRSITALGEFPKSQQGKHDGLFEIRVKNDYDLNLDLLNPDGGDSNSNKKKDWDIGDRNDYYRWVDQLEEGQTVQIPIPSKNITYVVKSITGDVSSLPPELLVANSTELRGDNTIVVSLQNSAVGQKLPENTRVEKIGYNPGTESIEFNKITVPINNCGGNARISQRYTQSQTFVHEYRQEIDAGISADIGVAAWLRLVPELQAKFGFEQGQIDSRTVEYEMAAEPQTNVTYIFSWKEEWDSGTASVVSGADTILVPFRVKTNLIYEVDSMPLTCGS